jgi:hypothetical protein
VVVCPIGAILNSIDESKELGHIQHLIENLEHKVNQILRLLTPSQELVLKILVEGKEMGNPATLGAKGGQCSAQDGSGNPYKLSSAAPLLFATDNAAIATVDVNGAITSVASGSCNIACKDPGNGLQDSVAVTVTLVAGKLVLVVTPN